MVILIKTYVELQLIIFFLAVLSCQEDEAEMKALMLAIDDFETAWASNVFLIVESCFTADAKRLHTESYVWDRVKIKEYFKERAAIRNKETQSGNKKDWKAGREYIEIRKEGNIAYDI